jgi:hypothetical protein
MDIFVYTGFIPTPDWNRVLIIAGKLQRSCLAQMLQVKDWKEKDVKENKMASVIYLTIGMFSLLFMALSVMSLVSIH